MASLPARAAQRVQPADKERELHDARHAQAHPTSTPRMHAPTTSARARFCSQHQAAGAQLDATSPRTSWSARHGRPHRGQASGAPATHARPISALGARTLVGTARRFRLGPHRVMRQPPPPRSAFVETAPFHTPACPLIRNAVRKQPLSRARPGWPPTPQLTAAARPHAPPPLAPPARAHRHARVRYAVGTGSNARVASRVNAATTHTHRQRRRPFSANQRRARCPRRAASSARRGAAHAAPGPASLPLAGLRLPAFTDAPTSAARSSAPASNPAFTTTPGAISRTATSRPARKLPSSSTRRTPATSRPRATLPRAECAHARRRWRHFRRRLRPPTLLRPDAPQTRRAPHRALRARASGSFPSPLLLGPLPASDEGQGLKAAPEAE